MSAAVEAVPMPDDETPAARLRRLRIDLGMTQIELAKRAGVSEAAIRRAEADPPATPYPRTQLKIARVFGLHPSDIWPVH